MEHLDKLAREPYTAVMSCELDLGVDWVVDRCWEMLQLIRVYTKRYVSPLHLSFSDLVCSRRFLRIILRPQ
jgi:ribosome-interacting GTPase 1